MKYLKHDNSYARATGFTLIEILVALLVVMVGLAALLQLQSSFIQGVDDSEKRAIGIALAEKKLEELRSYQNLVDFETIGSGTTSEAQAVSVGSGSITYNLDWSAINTVSAAGSPSKYKEVTVAVSWPCDAGSCDLTLSSIIARIDPSLSGFLSNGGVGGDSPTVSHAAGAIPDVIPIEIGNGTTRETSKPLPDVDQSNESTEVRFETVTYDTASNKQVQEEFVTVNCFCQLDSFTGADGQKTTRKTPYHYKYSDGELAIASGESYDLTTGDKIGIKYTGNGSFTQSAYCDRCCEGHHDAPEMSIYSNSEVPGFKNATPAAQHKHFEVNTSTGLLTGDEASDDGDVYAEACRLRRVDGLFRLFPDWKLIELTAFPYNYAASTASSSLAAYQQYVTERVQDEVFLPYGASSAVSTLPSTDLNTLPDTLTQLLARGIYYEDMSYDSGWTAQIASISNSTLAMSEKDWLQYTPFFEVNMTLLAEWSTDDDTIADVSDEEVNTVADAIANYYGVYSRGLVEATGVASEATNVVATSKTDNTGILGNRFGVNSSFTGENNAIVLSSGTVSSAVAVSILSAGSSVSISGEVREDNTGGNVTVAANKTSVSVSSGSCTYQVTGGVGNFNCSVPQNAGNVLVSVTTSQNSQYIDPDVSAGGDIVLVTPGDAATSSDGSITVNVGTSGVTGVNFAARHD